MPVRRHYQEVGTEDEPLMDARNGVTPIRPEDSFKTKKIYVVVNLVIALVVVYVILALRVQSPKIQVIQPSQPVYKDFEKIADCATIQGNFYNEHFGEFAGEAGSTVLKNILNQLLIDKFEKINVVDVGANVGQIFDFLKHPDFKIELFEPNPVNAEVLRKKFASNPNVNIHQNAVSNSSGTSYFFFNHGKTKNEVGNQHGALGPTMSGGDTMKNMKEKVEVVTLDDVIEPTLEHLHLLKTDTEGFDTIALYGAKKLLQKTDLLVFECHVLQHSTTGGPGTTDYEVADYLSKLAFEVYHIHPRALLRFDGPFYNTIYDQKKTWQNCFAVKHDYEFKEEIINQYKPLCTLSK